MVLWFNKIKYNSSNTIYKPIFTFLCKTQITKVTSVIVIKSILILGNIFIFTVIDDIHLKLSNKFPKKHTTNTTIKDQNKLYGFKFKIKPL